MGVEELQCARGNVHMADWEMVRRGNGCRRQDTVSRDDVEVAACAGPLAVLLEDRRVLDQIVESRDVARLHVLRRDLARLLDPETGVRVGGYCFGLRHVRCSGRAEEHTSELQSLMRRSYAVF